MSHWNYRVVECDDDLRIYDVYYDDAGKAISRHIEPTYVYGESIDDLRAQLQLMLAALEVEPLQDAAIGGSDMNAASK
jgi:hypothetical protein